MTRVQFTHGNRRSRRHRIGSSARRQRDAGATSVEYAILIGFIAVVAAAAFFGLGTLVLDFFNQGKGAFE